VHNYKRLLLVSGTSNETFQKELSLMYADQPKGHPPVPPAQLALTTILQAYTGASDAEAIEALTVSLGRASRTAMPRCSLLDKNNGREQVHVSQASTQERGKILSNASDFNAPVVNGLVKSRVSMATKPAWRARDSTSSKCNKKICPSASGWNWIASN
jgi:hypothetical protein